MKQNQYFWPDDYRAEMLANTSNGELLDRLVKPKEEQVHIYLPYSEVRMELIKRLSLYCPQVFRKTVGRVTHNSFVVGYDAGTSNAFLLSNFLTGDEMLMFDYEGELNIPMAGFDYFEFMTFEYHDSGKHANNLWGVRIEAFSGYQDFNIISMDEISRRFEIVKDYCVKQRGWSEPNVYLTAQFS